MTQSCRSLLTDRWQVTDRVMYQFQVLNVTKSSRSVRFVLLCIKIHQLFAIFECALNKVCMLNLNLINSWDQEGCNITNDLPELCKSCCCHESLVSPWPPSEQYLTMYRKHLRWDFKNENISTRQNRSGGVGGEQGYSGSRVTYNRSLNET